MEYIQISEDGVLPNIAGLAPFKAILAIEDPVSPERRRQVSEWLVAMGAMYLMICGEDCETWQHNVRRANLARVPLDQMEPHQFVMITTHLHERLRSVFRHARKYARHTHVKMTNIVTVHVARQNREVDYHNLFSKR